MRNTTRFFFVAFSFSFFISASAQTYSGYSDISVTLKSDTTTKSAMISNLLEDRVGDVSPIIGTAAWSDNDKRLQCRSLLSFDYGVLPLLIKPDLIIEALLILKPVEIITQETMNGARSPKFAIRRITEPWEDSMTSWLTQPAAVTEDEVIKFIPENKKRRNVKIDVTEMVRDMFRFGNNGFMISYDDSLETTTFLSQWFASARYEDQKLRPELWIRWETPLAYSNPFFNTQDISPMPRDNTRGPVSYYSGGQSSGVNQEPVHTPVTTTTDVPPPKVPPKTGIGEN